MQNILDDWNKSNQIESNKAISELATTQIIHIKIDHHWLAEIKWNLENNWNAGNSKVLSPNLAIYLCLCLYLSIYLSLSQT